jgi:hypothetical protein
VRVGNPILRAPFALLDDMPASLDDVVLDFASSRAQLWALELPVTRVPVAALRWQLDLPMWSDGGAPFRPRPSQVAAHPEHFSQQHARTMAADLSFALHVLSRPAYRPTVLDGIHRLLRAAILGHETLAAAHLTEHHPDQIAIPAHS